MKDRRRSTFYFQSVFLKLIIYIAISSAVSLGRWSYHWCYGSIFLNLEAASLFYDVAFVSKDQLLVAAPWRHGKGSVIHE
jgi:hypothetical protein